jgi:hypothetical protein
MLPAVIVWDIETVPYLRGFAVANGLVGKSDDEVRAEMGAKFPKLIYHSIVGIGPLVAGRQEERWSISAVGALHIGERSEKEIISACVKRIADLAPQLVTFNGASFDLPVLRYRAMVCRVAAPGLALRPYFNRYTEDAIDQCDVLPSRTNLRYASCAASWGYRGSPTESAGRTSRVNRALVQIRRFVSHNPSFGLQVNPNPQSLRLPSMQRSSSIQHVRPPSSLCSIDDSASQCAGHHTHQERAENREKEKCAHGVLPSSRARSWRCPYGQEPARSSRPKRSQSQLSEGQEGQAISA